jgi:hypothetical protein
MYVRALVLGALVACESAQPVPADCSTVSAGVKKYWEDRAKETTDPAELAAIAESSKVASEKLERHCRADSWNEDMIKCTRAVFRLDDSGCMKHLSRVQKARLEGTDQGGVGIVQQPSPAAPSTEQCKQLLEHIVGLEVAKSGGDKQAIIDSTSANFLAQCTQKTSRKVIECALAAPDLEAIAKCYQ